MAQEPPSKEPTAVRPGAAEEAARTRGPIEPVPRPPSPTPPKAPAAPAKKDKVPEPAQPPAGNVARFEKEAADLILERTPQCDQWSFTIKPSRIADAASHLRSLGFDHLACLTAVDYLDPEVAKANYPPGSNPPDGPPRIEVVYNLFSYESRERVALRAKLPRDAPHLPSIAHLWKAADWLEREVYDLFGVRFDGHPDLRRILLPDGWTGHPLRKDYDRTKEQFVNLDPETGEDTVSFEEGKGW